MLKINNVEVDEQELISKGWSPPKKVCGRKRAELGGKTVINCVRK